MYIYHFRPPVTWLLLNYWWNFVLIVTKDLVSLIYHSFGKCSWVITSYVLDYFSCSYETNIIWVFRFRWYSNTCNLYIDIKWHIQITIISFLDAVSFSLDFDDESKYFVNFGLNAIYYKLKNDMQKHAYEVTICIRYLQWVGRNSNFWILCSVNFATSELNYRKLEGNLEGIYNNNKGFQSQWTSDALFNVVFCNWKSIPAGIPVPCILRRAIYHFSPCCPISQIDQRSWIINCDV